MHKENAKHAWFTVNQPETGLTTSLVIASQVLSFENICMVTVFGPPHRFSSDADWFGKIALNKHNLWIQEIKEEENLPCIQNWKLYDGQCTPCCIIRHVSILGQTVKI